MRIRLMIITGAVGSVAAATAAIASPATPVHPRPTHTTPAAVTSANGRAALGSPTRTAAPGHSNPGHGKPGHVRVINLTVHDNGKTIRVSRGEQIRVTLAVDLKQNPDASTWWHTVTESGGALKPLPQTLMAARGVTNARYQVIAKDRATLSSSRAVCPSHWGAPACHSMQRWQVKITVR